MLSGKLFQKVRPSICQIGAGGLNWYTRPWHCLFLTDELAPLEISLNIIISRNDIICQHQFVSYCNADLEFNFRFSISWKKSAEWEGLNCEPNTMGDLADDL